MATVKYRVRTENKGSKTHGRRSPKPTYPMVEKSRSKLLAMQVISIASLICYTVLAVYSALLFTSYAMNQLVGRQQAIAVGFAASARLLPITMYFLQLKSLKELTALRRLVFVLLGAFCVLISYSFICIASASSAQGALFTFQRYLFVALWIYGLL